VVSEHLVASRDHRYTLTVTDDGNVMTATVDRVLVRYDVLQNFLCLIQGVQASSAVRPDFGAEVLLVYGYFHGHLLFVFSYQLVQNE
jgi:hypothetical protein